MHKRKGEKMINMLKTNPISNYLNNLYKSIQSKITLSTGLLSFLSGMIGFYIVHGGFFTQRFVNDDYHHGIYDGSGIFFIGSNVVSGRFLGGLVGYLNPWMIGFICAILISLVAIFIIKTFDVKNKISIILISLSVVSFPCLSVSYGYLFAAQNYSIAILCSVLAVYMTKRYKYGFIAGSIFLMISLAEYQAYVALTMALSAVCIYIYMVNAEKIKKDFYIYCAKYLAMGVLGVSIYFVILNIILKVRNLTLADYRGINEMGKVNLSELPTLILSTYKSFADFFIGEKLFYLPKIIKIAFGVFAIITLYLIYKMIKQKSIVTKLFTFIIILVFPICLSIVQIMAPKTYVDTITAYAFVMCIITPLILLDYSKRNIVNIVMGVLALAIIINNYAINSRYYLFVDVVYEQTFAFENRLYSRIEETEGFEYGMPIAIVADNRTEILKTNYNNYTSFPELRGERGIFKKYIGLSQDFLRNTKKTVNLFINMLGADVTYASEEQIDAIMKTYEFEQLTVYPAQGSIKVIDGIMTVNFIDHERLSSDNVNVETNGNTISITHTNRPEEVETAWYIYTEDDIIKIWYTDSNTLNYSFDEDGSYSITLFVRDKLDRTNGDAITACSFEVIDGQIKNVKQ